MERTPGTRFAHAARRSSTSARAMRAATASSGAVEKATRTSASVEAATMGEPSVLREREAIRHAGDVVGDRAGLAIAGEMRAHLLRKPGGIAPVHEPQFFEDALGLLGRRDHVGVVVEVAVQEFLELAQALRERGRVLEPAARRGAHRVDAGGLRVVEPL